MYGPVRGALHSEKFATEKFTTEKFTTEHTEDTEGEMKGKASKRSDDVRSILEASVLSVCSVVNFVPLDHGMRSHLQIERLLGSPIATLFTHH